MVAAKPLDGDDLAPGERLLGGRDGGIGTLDDTSGSFEPKARAARKKPALVLIHGDPEGPALAAPSSITGMPGQTP